MRHAVLAAGLIIALASQASAFSLTGSWDCGPVRGPSFDINGQLSYKANGKLRHTISATGERDGDDLEVTIRIWGTWSIAGTALDENITRHTLRAVRINGRRINAGPEWDELAAGLARSFDSGQEDDDPVKIRPTSDASFDYIDDPMVLPCVRTGTTPTS